MKKEFLYQAAQSLGTPLYLFHLDRLHQRMERIRSYVGTRAGLCYAVKANPFLVQALNQEVERFEVCSPGEYRICRSQGLPPEKLVISGVNKSQKDTEEMMEQCPHMGIYTAESLHQWHLLHQCAEKHGQTIRVLLRLTSGNQFGMEEETLRQIIRERNQWPHSEIVGIQMYSGTQKHSLKRLQRELDRLDDLVRSLQEEEGFLVQELEYGPGFPVFYFEEDEPWEEEEFFRSFAQMLENMAFSGTITLEMGRSMVAECGYYLTSVADIKSSRGQNYCILDGGMHQISYYGQSMAMKHPPVYCLQERSGEPVPWNLCGSLCTVNDILVKQLPLPTPELGDVFVFEKAGAYCVTEGIALFLSRDLPAVASWSQSQGLELLRPHVAAETFNQKQ